MGMNYKYRFLVFIQILLIASVCSADHATVVEVEDYKIPDHAKTLSAVEASAVGIKYPRYKLIHKANFQKGYEISGDGTVVRFSWRTGELNCELDVTRPTLSKWFTDSPVMQRGFQVRLPSALVNRETRYAQVTFTPAPGATLKCRRWSSKNPAPFPSIAEVDKALSKHFDVEEAEPKELMEPRRSNGTVRLYKEVTRIRRRQLIPDFPEPHFVPTPHGKSIFQHLRNLVN